jgi:hypothetical protein
MDWDFSLIFVAKSQAATALATRSLVSMTNRSFFGGSFPLPATKFLKLTNQVVDMLLEGILMLLEFVYGFVAFLGNLLSSYLVKSQLFPG